MNNAITSFEKENNVILNFKEMMNTIDIDKETLYDEYRILGKEYKSIFNQFKKILRISDSVQMKLIETQEKLKEQNNLITKQMEIIEIEKAKSEKLLLNVLPSSIANRLRNGESQIADYFEEASVVFIDIVDFTKSSSGVNPKQIVEILNDIYTKLDFLAEKHGLEKIKTIGDCYMAASGVPVIRKDNAEIAAKFAIDSMQMLKNYQIFKSKDGFKSSENSDIINFRCGIDCGSVIAGVIGEQKFIYDIWGDTVNIASRMEEYGEPGRIQVTEKFKTKLINMQSFSKNKFYFEERGEIEIKGKGNMITYFLFKEN